MLMKPAIIMTVLLSSALGFGQKFQVSDLSAFNSQVSFTGTAKVSKLGTTCAVAMHNNSTQSLLAVEVKGEVTSPWGWMQPTALSYDAFFKETGIPAGGDFDLVRPDFFDSMHPGTTDSNGDLKTEVPKKDLVCKAVFTVRFVQFEDGSTLGDYQTKKDVMARRDKSMAILTHFVEAYDAGGESAFAAALDEAESRPTAHQLNDMAAYFKIPLIDLVRKRLAAAQRRQASGIF